MAIKGKIKSAMRSVAKATKWGYAISPAIIFGTALLAWYDPSDLSTLFQDSAGTLSVTAVEQPVGLILDKSKGLASILVFQDNFDAGISNWTNQLGDGSIAANPGTLKVTRVTAGASGYRSFNTIAGKTYKFTVKARRLTGTAVAGLAVRDAANTGASADLGIHVTSATDLTPLQVIFRETISTTRYIHLGAFTNPGTVEFDDFLQVELPGNHLAQATPASRYVYSKRYNLLTKTADLSNAVWNKTAITISGTDTMVDIAGAGLHQIVGPSFSGAGNLTLTAEVNPLGKTWVFISIYDGVADRAAYFDLANGVKGAELGGATLTAKKKSDGTWQLKLTGTTAGTFYQIAIGAANSDGGRNYVATGIPALRVSKLDLRTSADAALLIPPYQWVDTATSYDEIGFWPYLQADGVDDSAATAGTVDLSTKNRITLFAAWTKQIDGPSTGVLVELTTDTSANNGGFIHHASSLGNGIVAQGMKGTLAAAFTQTVAAAHPLGDTLCILSRYDLSTPTNQSMRSNRVDRATDATDTGASVFANARLFTGRRNDATLPVKARIYQLFLVEGIPTSRATEFAERFLAIKSAKALA